MQSAQASGAHSPTSPPPMVSMLERCPISLFLDFDGTLVELAAGPDAICPIPDLSSRLRALDARENVRCAIISGRSIADIERHLGPLPIAVAGSHGSDIRSASGRTLGQGPQSLPQNIEAQLRAFASSEGLDYEHKPHGGALHYRGEPDHGPRAHAFVEALAQKYGWVSQSGKYVVELVAKGADKRSAVTAFMADDPFAGARPIFIGDDLTDEAGFRECQALGGVGILVGERSGTCAQYTLADVSAVHQWLEL